jgi:CRP-like cAMP-binding protein
MYFPIDTLISLRCDLESGFTAEFGQIGREGFVGFSALMGSVATQNTAVVQTEGDAYRISSAAIQKVFDNSPHFRRVTLQYMQALMQEAAQGVICNRFHSITEQYCRSLLLASDRLGSQAVPLTHEQLAVIIGCRREAVSLAARKLQSAGLISYTYGQIVILDRPGLEARSCECYGAIRQGFSMFFHDDQSVTADSTGVKIEGA